MGDEYNPLDDTKENKGRPRASSSSSLGIFILVLLFLSFAGLCALSVAVGVKIVQLEGRAHDTETALQMQGMTQNATIGYLQTLVGMLALGGNTTLLEQGVCHLWSMEIEAPFANIVNPVDSGLLVNYSIYSREGGTYAVFSEFAGIPVPSYTFVRPAVSTDCDALHPQVQYLTTFAFTGCTQDPTGATFTQSLLNDVLQYGSSQFVLRSEQRKFSFGGGSVSTALFGNMFWWSQPPTCFENQYTIQQSDYAFPTPTNMYLFNVGIDAPSSTVALNEPLMLLLTATNVK